MNKNKEEISEGFSEFSRKLDSLYMEMWHAERAGKIKVREIVQLSSIAMGNVMAANVNPNIWEYIMADVLKAAVVSLESYDEKSRYNKFKKQ